jgi:hypothetical protein
MSLDFTAFEEQAKHWSKGVAGCIISGEVARLWFAPGQEGNKDNKPFEIAIFDWATSMRCSLSYNQDADTFAFVSGPGHFTEEERRKAFLSVWAEEE